MLTTVSVIKRIFV